MQHKRPLPYNWTPPKPQPPSKLYPQIVGNLPSNVDKWGLISNVFWALYKAGKERAALVYANLAYELDFEKALVYSARVISLKYM